MGKTVNGALWLDAKKTSPYEFYQYWRNIKDDEVNDVLRMLTYLPMSEVNRLSDLEGNKINEAKKVAAYEITKLIHGEDEANKARKTSEELFETQTSSKDMPTINIDKSTLIDDKISLVECIVAASIAPSKSQARTLIAQGGIYLNDEKITDISKELTKNDFEKGDIILKKGKKVFVKLVLK